MSDPYREPIKDGPAPEAKTEKTVSPEGAGEVKKAEQPAVSLSQEAVGPSVVLPSSPPQSSVVAPAPAEELKSLDRDRQLKILVDLAFQQGINKAVEADKATESPYLIDEFHDTLVDQLRQQLIEKGKLKEL